MFTNIFCRYKWMQRHQPMSAFTGLCEYSRWSHMQWLSRQCCKRNLPRYLYYLINHFHCFLFYFLLVIDGCTNTTICANHSHCENTTDSHICVCDNGYQQDSVGQCYGIITIVINENNKFVIFWTDIDKCKDEDIIALCAPYYCVNAPGNYTCKPCPNGFTFKVLIVKVDFFSFC